MKKKFVENVVRKKSLLLKLMKKYVNQKKHQMVTYIIRKAYDKNIYFSPSTKNLKKIV